MKKGHFVLIGCSVLLVVALSFLPRTKAEVQSEPETSSDQRVEEALRKVQSGENPMEGVMMLRAILEEDPDHLQATYALGMLSMQSGQFELAVKRFDRVLEIDPNQVEAYRLKGEAYEAMGQAENALIDYQLYVEKSDDLKAKESIGQRIKELKD